MKIGLIASIWITVPPKGFGYGAQEYLAYYIAEGLVKKGHEVTLFASGDSQTHAKLVSVTDKPIDETNFPDQKIKDIFELMNLSEAYKMADQFDIFHNHLLPYGVLFADWSKTPTVHTLHHAVHRDRADIFLYDRFKNQNYISISHAQRKILPELNYISTVYNGVDTNFYEYAEDSPGEYLLYIGRLKKYKGIHTVIKLGQELGLPVKIACPEPNISQPDYKEVNEYWENEVRPQLKGNIEHIGVVEGKNKIQLLQNAKALVFPVEHREEPFGMTLIEAMACGTPVIAYPGGAIPEIVEDNKTGYLINEEANDIRGNWTTTTVGFEGMKQAVQKLYNLKPEEYRQMRKQSREHVVKNFSVEKMVDDYEKVYKLYINK